MGIDVMKGHLKLNTTHFLSAVICMLSDYMSAEMLSHFMGCFAVPMAAGLLL